MKIVKVLSLVVVLSFGFGILTNMEKSSADLEMTNTVAKNTLEFTDANFGETIEKGLVLVDFWAPWCGPCRTQGPIIDEIATAYKGKVKVGKLNIDNNKQIQGRYHVRSIPTLILFKDGKVVERMVGVQSFDRLEEKIKKYL